MKRFLSAFGVVILVSLGLWFVQPKTEPSFGAPVNTYIKYVTSTAVSADIFCLTGDLPCISTWSTGTGGGGLFFNGFMTSSLYVTDGTTTSTLRSDALYLATSTANMLGLFNVDSSGNVSASGTLRVFGTASSTFTSTTALTTNALFQGGLGDCLQATGKLLYTQASGLFNCGTDVSSTPGGSGTHVQYNDYGSFGGTSNFTFNTSTNYLTVTNIKANGFQLTLTEGTITTGFVIDAAADSIQALSDNHDDWGAPAQRFKTGYFYTFDSNRVTSTFVSSSVLSISDGFFQNGLGECNDDVDTLMYNSVTGKFECGDDDSVSFTGALYGYPFSTTNGTNTSTLRWDGLYIATSTNNALGLFSVDSSGNTSVSGTLRVFSGSIFANTTSSNVTSTALHISGGARFANGLISNVSSSFATATFTKTTSTNSTSTAFHVSGSSRFAGGLIANASSSFLTATFTGVSSTALSVSGGARFSNGLIINASSSLSYAHIANALSVSSSAFVSTSLFLGQSPGKVLGTFNVSGLTGNISASGTLQLGDTYTARTALKSVTLYNGTATTTDIISLRSFRTAVTIRSVQAVIDCPNGCHALNPGFFFDLRHGTDRSASTTATSLFSSSINVNSTSTLQTWCPTNTYATACTRIITFNDNTLAAGEHLWFDAGTASTSQMNLSISIEYSED